MSWEALRLTSKTPTEVYNVLGPHGVEELIRDARNACWREYPQDVRTVAKVKARLIEVFERNMKVWAAIKKPTPAAFFENLLPHAADGHIRQALVLTWMMLPRAGGRDFKDTIKIIRHIFDRTIAAWNEDDRIFTTGFGKKRAASAAPKSKSARPKPKAASKAKSRRK